ncbi:uncharacterized protein LOC134700920 [Mytilus trossulus]|uniref:uncharacterized protein LOC134700920 n=1 Tax=Mytilus trossulus TaxID=6551 RepID=UPI0030049FC3
MRQETADIESRLCQQFGELQNSTILLVSDINTDANLRMQNLSTLLTGLEDKIESRSDFNLASQNRTVALTACGGGGYNSGDIAKFGNVKQHKGFRNLDAFKQSGTFTCEVGGMYVFFASLISSSPDVHFRLYKDSVPQNYVFISSRPPSYESGSGMLAVQLTVGDTITLKSVISNAHINGASCITIFKFQ